LAIALYQITQ